MQRRVSHIHLRNQNRHCVGQTAPRRRRCQNLGIGQLGVDLQRSLGEQFGVRPNPHRTRDATRNATQANGTWWCEWGCSHCTQATSKETRSNLRAHPIPRPVWIRPKQLKTQFATVHQELGAFTSDPTNQESQPQYHRVKVEGKYPHRSSRCTWNGSALHSGITGQPPATNRETSVPGHMYMYVHAILQNRLS